MNLRTTFSSISFPLAVSVSLLVAGSAAAQKGKGGGGSAPSIHYRVTPISLNSPLFVKDLSDSSAAVGYIRAADERIAIVWTKETGIVPLQGLLSEPDQQQWHLEVLEAINDSGQIVGFASVPGGDENQNWAAFRLDWPNGWLKPGAVLTILEESLGNGEGALKISNAGDVVLSIWQETTFYYPPNFPTSTKVDLEFPLWVTGVNVFGEIIGDTAGGGVRITLKTGGGYDTKFFPGGPLWEINDAGTIAGAFNDGRTEYLFRYTDDAGELVLMDGRKKISGFIRGMNNEGDIAISGPAVFTAEGKYLKLNDLIHPDDVAGYRGDQVRGIASRNDTGLPAVVVSYTTGYTGGSPSLPIYDNFFLTPESSGN